MPRRQPPKYRLHKPTGQALVEIKGKRVYLGPHGSPESHEKYHRILAEHLSQPGMSAPTVDGTKNPTDRTITELCLGYLSHARGYYRDPDGGETTEVACIVRALKTLRALYGRTLAKDFGPLKLKATREQLIREGLSRSGTNAAVRRIKRAFRWAVENELIPPSVDHGLKAVAGLKRGRCDARETEPVGPVPEPVIEATLRHAPPAIVTLARLQLLSGARPSELLGMRGCDLDRTGEVWVLRPARHKTAWLGRAREIYFGPRAQELLRPWLLADPRLFVFSPKRTEEQRNAERREARKTPRWPSHQKRKPVANRKRPPRERYDVCSYRRALHRAADLANKKALASSPGTSPETRLIPRWSPHRLRHNAATNIRREHGVELARIILGHADLNATEIYAEADQLKALACVASIG